MVFTRTVKSTSLIKNHAFIYSRLFLCRYLSYIMQKVDYFLFLKKFSMYSDVTDFGLSSGMPRARSQKT